MNQLKKLREEKGLSVFQLSVKADVLIQTIYRTESGKDCNGKTFAKLQRALPDLKFPIVDEGE